MSERDKDEISAQDLDRLDDDQLVRLGTRLDDVELVQYAERWPVPGTRMERRALRRVTGWFVLAGASAIALIAVFLFWPWEYLPPGAPGYVIRTLYTPMIGLTFGLTLLGLAVGAVKYAKQFLPQELAVQQRHSGSSADADKRTVAAEFRDAATRSGLRRRTLFRRVAATSAGLFGVGLGVMAIGPLVRDPWKRSDSPDSLWHTGWKAANGETVYLRLDTTDPHEVVLVRPEDLRAGGYVTVFPFRESEREDPERLSAAVRRADSAAMLFRLRPGEQVTVRPGHENLNLDDFYVYSKVCTHLGCPVSLYEQQTGRLLCPCHQSQFDVRSGAIPIFGPATRPLPQLPLALSPDGYFIATGDFTEVVGPGFWELKP
ncbi:Rieske Fe-S protein [Lentzea atacamensis]|uniref:Cytochrome bc1 complex Rieske iron-sulfur subunit n=1 Tax=Lentzea atacamensis TaxID=531938 RepID=A0A316HW03_9PSEU|nr:ubiquinol-cytochrome c reductase iron-sulfur subunit [Lentzea atacamensis]PWK84617.1 Rieske Fe-S protein [Lentzea atacamensis]